LGIWGLRKIVCMHTISVPAERDSATIVPDEWATVHRPCRPRPSPTRPPADGRAGDVGRVASGGGQGGQDGRRRWRGGRIGRDGRGPGRERSSVGGVGQLSINELALMSVPPLPI
jgi:hypothetical protein